MKKIIAAFLAAATALALSGCAGGGEKSGSDPMSEPNGSTVNTPSNSGAPGGEDNNSNISGNGGAPGGTNSENDGGRDLVPLYNDGITLDSIALGSKLCTEDGYYRIQSLGDDWHISNITYVDFASKREIVLCSDSSCRHNIESCASYISDHEMFFPRIFVFNDKLWLLSSDYYQEGSMGSEYHAPGYEPEPETRRAAIFRMNLDGTEREKVYEAELGDIIEMDVFGYGDDLLFIVKTPTVDTVKNNKGNVIMFYGSKNRALLRFSVSQNKVVERIPLDPYKNISLNVRNCTGSHLIFAGTAYPDGKSKLDFMDILAFDTGHMQPPSKEQEELSNNCEIVFFTLDLDTKELKEVFREKSGSRNSYSVYGSELYIKHPDNTVSAFNVLSGTTRSVNIPSGYEFRGIYMNKLKLYQIGKGSEITYFADLDGTNITSSKLFDYMGDDRLWVLAVAGDKAIVQYDEEREKRPEGGYTRTGIKLGLISIDDLMSGRRNIDRINNLGKSNGGLL